MKEEVGFRRNLGLFMAVMIGIGAMMGPGIFALPAEVAEMIGPLGIFSYLAMGLLTIFTALNYAELGVAELFEIGTGVASLVSVVVPDGAKVAGRLIKDIEMPLECVVAAVIRGKQFVVPRGKTEILSADQVIFVGPATAAKRAKDVFLDTG